MKKIIYAVVNGLIFMIFLNVPVTANEAVLRRDAALNNSPTSSAAVIVNLQVGTSVLVKQRKGLWAEACAEQLCGWVRVTSLALARSGPTTSSSLAGLKSGREGAGNAVSSTGVRGLDAASIELSTPDYDALAVLESAQIPVSGAISFAAEQNLEQRSLALLTAPVVSEPSADSSPQPSRAPVKKAKKKSKPTPEKDAYDDDW